MHLLEYLALLAADAHAHGQAELGEFRADPVERLPALGGVDDHHHVEVAAGDGLADVKDVDVLLGEVRAGLRENADGILAHDSDYDLVHGQVLYQNIVRAAQDTNHIMFLPIQ